MNIADEYEYDETCVLDNIADDTDRNRACVEMMSVYVHTPPQMHATYANVSCMQYAMHTCRI